MFERMRELRKAKGLSLKQLGDMVGVAEVTISTYETGKRLPPVDIVCAIADVFDVSLDYLVRGKEKDRPVGRSLKEMVSDYENLPNDVLEMNIVVSQAILAERRLQAHSQTDGKENP